MIKKNLSNSQMLIINMFASALTYLVTFFVGFFLSPYIVKSVGVDAYGFVNLADSFVGYASLSAVALNALAGRYITVSYHKNDIEEANKYYSSVFFANCLLSAIILIVEAVVWIKLETIINIPKGILSDVKVLFAVLFVNSIITTVGSVFSIATFATNKLYISSFRTIESQLIRAIFLFCSFFFFAPKVQYLGIATLFTGIYVFSFNIKYMRVLLPELQINLKFFDIKSIWMLIKSGVWVLITRASAILFDGLDLLITNLFIDAASMGVLSLAKTVPTIIRSIVGSVSGVFSPNLTILYAQGKKEELVKYIRQSMKILCVLTNLPIIVLVVCGIDFFTLWQPTQDPNQLQLLSILTIISFVINGSLDSIYYVYTLVDRLKVNSVALLISGVVSAMTTYLLVKNTDLGIIAVAGTSTVVTILLNIIVSIPYAAKCLKLKWYTFYAEVLRSVLFFCVSVGICWIISRNIIGTNWLMLMIKGAVCSAVVMAIGLFVVLNKDDRAVIKSKLLRKNK